MCANIDSISFVFRSFPLCLKNIQPSCETNVREATVLHSQGSSTVFHTVCGLFIGVFNPFLAFYSLKRYIVNILQHVIDHYAYFVCILYVYIYIYI